jgi:hypothetical protein
VESLLLENPQGLSRLDISLKIAEQIEFSVLPSKEEVDQFYLRVYSEGIMYLIRKGKIVVGKSRQQLRTDAVFTATIYKHVRHASKDELPRVD